MEIHFYYKLSVNSHENTAGSGDNFLDDKSHKVQYTDPVIIRDFHICLYGGPIVQAVS